MHKKCGEFQRERITIFQQENSALSKITGMKRFASDRLEITVFNIDDELPDILDDTSQWLPDSIDADLVIDYLTHPDLSVDLAFLCQKEGVPVVASGKKISGGHAITPCICCMLTHHDELGLYGRLFGAPEIKLNLKNDIIEKVEVIRGAPCGATWDAARKIEGLDVEYAKVRYGLEVQFFCTADPASWDPIYGKSPVHMAADIHSAAFRKSLKEGVF
ncbi:conserved hypothetical protein [Desulfamplus magnetovallimortis]|uniref:Uncharacterized protein n=1 Tax=Desulfamplus magnetovallimortis TaxID=1246637 RepID=A0A1W1H4W5_9BACT|nr:DUF166 family (seleno)protein DfsP [Desulfamplus magnetovallimortis]SLM27408.1 conserved hypothetical protein [Desulfamplus magnetovallimortis]